MKNLKKVLALVLAFACAFTMFAGALTFSDVQSGDDYAAAITMLSDLEVISGNGKGAYEPTKAITRAEACVLIANIMNGGKADTARFAGGSNFSDVAKTYWGESAIAYCVQNGVTYGVGGGKFAPERVITDAEFVAMVTRAMGYDTPTNPLRFPYGNYTAAVDNGIVDNVPYVEGSDCTKGEAAQILYDCLFADYARYTANQNLIHNADDDHDFHNKLIDVVFGLNRAALGSGKWTSDNFDCKAHYWVITGNDCGEEDTIVAYPITDKDNTLYDKKDAYTFEFEGDATELVGYKVILWGEESHSNDDPVIDKVKAIEVVDGVNDEGQTVYEYNPTMNDDDDNGKHKFDDETIEFSNVQNAEMFGKNADKKAIEKAMNVKDGASYKIFDWDNDGEADYIVKTVNEYYEVVSASSKNVKLSGLDGGLLDGATVKVGDDTKVKFDCVRTDKDSFEHDIAISVPSDLETDDIVCLTYVRAGLKGEISNACAHDEEGAWELALVEAETKEVTKISAKNEEVYFDGEIIDGAEPEQFDGDYDLEDQIAKNDEYVDDEFDLYLNANGYIIRVNDPSDSYDSYLFVLGQKDGKNKTGDRYEATITAMLADGTYKEDIDLDSDASVYIDEDEDGTISTAEKRKNIYDTDSNTFDEDISLIGHVFKYSMDGDVITKLTEVALSNDEDYTYSKNNEQFTVDGTKYWADKCDVIFAVKIGNDDAVDNLLDYTYEANYDVDEIDKDDVRVVSYSDLPNIYADKSTKGLGVRYDVKTKTTTSFDKVAAIGVDTFKYFKGSESTIALVTDVSAISDKYFEIDAYIPGKTEKTYKTVKKADLETSDWNDLGEAEDMFNAAGHSEMLYAELEFDTDGAVVGFQLYDRDRDGDMTVVGTDAIINNVMTDVTVGNGDYGVSRVILNRQNLTNGKLFVSKAQYTGKDNFDPNKDDQEDYTASIITSTDGTNVSYADSYDVYITEDDDENALPGKFEKNDKITVAGGFFTDELKIADTVDSSFFNDNIKNQGEYYFADVITNDDGDIIMVVVFDAVVDAENTASVEAWNGNDQEPWNGDVMYGDDLSNTMKQVAVKINGKDVTRDEIDEINVPTALKGLVSVATNNGYTPEAKWEDVVIGDVSNLAVGKYDIEVVTKDGASVTFTINVKAHEFGKLYVHWMASGDLWLSAGDGTNKLTDFCDIVDPSNITVSVGGKVVNTTATVLAGTDEYQITNLPADILGQKMTITISGVEGYKDITVSGIVNSANNDNNGGVWYSAN